MEAEIRRVHQRDRPGPTETAPPVALPIEPVNDRTKLLAQHAERSNRNSSPADRLQRQPSTEHSHMQDHTGASTPRRNEVQPTHAPTAGPSPFEIAATKNRARCGPRCSRTLKEQGIVGGIFGAVGGVKAGLGGAGVGRQTDSKQAAQHQIQTPTSTAQ